MWLGIVIGLAVGTVFGMISGYIFTVFESLAGYLQIKIESKKSPYVKDVTDTNCYVASKEDEINGKEEKVPAIGFDVSSYIPTEDDEEYIEEPEECKSVGFTVR